FSLDQTAVSVATVTGPWISDRRARSREDSVARATICARAFRGVDLESRLPDKGVTMENASPETFGTARDDTSVTKVIDRIPREGMDAQLEQAIRNLIAAALRFRGHLGVTVTRPSLPAQPGFRMVYRFDSCEHLRAWEESAEYARLVSEANRYTQG